MLRKLSAILMTLCLTVGAMTPLAHAAGGLRLVTSSQEAASQEVGFSGVSSNCQSFQATFNLSNSTAIYDFMANDVLDALPGIYTTYKQEGSAVTVYVTTKSGVLTGDGSLTLGTISANDGTNFTVEKASGVKVVGSDNSETTYTQVDQGGSSGGSSSGGSSSGGSSSGGSTTTTRTITIQSSFGGKVTASASFTDVAKGQWYADGVAWASANGVVSGYPDGSFRPNDTITRGQMAAILYQYARIQGKLDDSRADLSIFSDLDSLSAYAKEPMSWAVAQGLFSGVSADTLAPGGSTTRAQAAVILMAFSKAQG